MKLEDPLETSDLNDPVPTPPKANEGGWCEHQAACLEWRSREIRRRRFKRLEKMDIRELMLQIVVNLEELLDKPVSASVSAGEIERAFDRVQNPSKYGIY